MWRYWQYKGKRFTYIRYLVPTISAKILYKVAPCRVRMAVHRKPRAVI